MPVYEYECGDCGERTEAIRLIRQADDPIECEHCGSARTGRVHSVFAAGVGTSAAPDLPPEPCRSCKNPMGSCGMR